MCPLFLKSTDDVLAPRLSAVFRRLVRLGRIPACWIQPNVTKIPKGPSYSSVANYRPISIPSVSSKVFVRLVSVRLGDLWNAVVRFKPPGLFIENVRVPVMHFDGCPIHYKGQLENGQEARIAQIEFSAAIKIERVNHLGILYKLCSVGIRGSA